MRVRIGWRRSRRAAQKRKVPQAAGALPDAYQRREGGLGRQEAKASPKQAASAAELAKAEMNDERAAREGGAPGSCWPAPRPFTRE